MVALHLTRTPNGYASLNFTASRLPKQGERYRWSIGLQGTHIMSTNSLRAARFHIRMLEFELQKHGSVLSVTHGIVTPQTINKGDI